MWQNEWASQYLFLTGGKLEPKRYGNRRPILIPGNLFSGRDGWISIVASTDPGWKNLTRAMGFPELSEDPRFKSRKVRMTHRDELETIVGNWVMSFDSVEHVEDLLADQGGVQCGRVRTWKEMLEDMHTKERDLIAQVEDPILGNVSVMNSPFRTETSTIGVRGPAPLIGQHSTEIFQKLLGYSNKQVLDMVNQNALLADDSIMPSLVENLIGTDH